MVLPEHFVHDESEDAVDVWGLLDEDCLLFDDVDGASKLILAPRLYCGVALSKSFRI